MPPGEDAIHPACLPTDARTVIHQRVGQRGISGMVSAPVGVDSRPSGMNVREYVGWSMLRRSDPSTSIVGSLESLFMSVGMSTFRSSSWRSMKRTKRIVGSETATTSAGVSRKERSASSSACRRGRNADAGRACARAGNGERACRASLGLQAPGLAWVGVGVRHATNHSSTQTADRGTRRCSGGGSRSGQGPPHRLEQGDA